ncbi:hypothetical protein Sulku_0093 [Sulfuricurvum kujiense DSM 16994]|uniref:Replication initiation factor n=1 Tax=Sulfuricurvum kujiense (strain ATCC BAA-921 / DSM 16994 / JCM 11577 / YK-1) TaxID=709032 RepID=E4TWT0_SULKY|nr:hypothetical protein [Sulfuricurvum kujiense]ADR32761.1 hypothetical protein Sulku_0093 [Sulfuricurvum kujiense DSM 16994]
MNTSINAPLGTEQEELNGVASIEVYNFPTASGIDSAYYFIESNADYKEFFHYSIFSVVESAKESNGGYVPKDSLTITISDIAFIYLGKDQGFYFFADRAGAFRVGFKDPDTNQGVHDIRVQLQGIGIYALGLRFLADYINGTILKEISKPNYYITRADLNIFCQYDLGNIIEPEHIVTRKRKFERIIGKKKGYETLYIGKPPARLRVYNKALEIDHTSMKTHFLKSYLEPLGINVLEPFWNFEFECHRDFLKQYKINTLDDLLGNAEMLFHKMMEQIRLVDTATITLKDIEANRLYKAPTHPLWNYLDQAYTFNAIDQKKIPLERIVYAPKELNANDFIEEFRLLTQKYAEHSVIVNYEELRDVLHESRLWLTKKAQKVIKPFVPIELQTDQRKYLLTRNHTAVAILPKSLEYISDTELITLESLLIKALHQELSYQDQDISLIVKHTQAVNEEKERRRAGQKELELWQV